MDTKVASALGLGVNDAYFPRENTKSNMFRENDYIGKN